MVVCISGATGLVGNELLIQNLNDAAVNHVFVLSRKPLDFEHQKCTWLETDFATLHEVSVPLSIDVAYCALGTTLKKAGSKEVQQQIDRDFVIDFAMKMQQSGCKSIGVISSLGANASSKNFYLRTKGEMEDGVTKSAISSINFIRPSVLIGPRKEVRFLEKFSMYLMLLLNPLFVGSWRKYRGITGIDVAQKIILLTKKMQPGVHFVDLTKK